MPTISWFYGIYIRMYVKDHAPPHFHAVYGEHEAYVSIETGEVIEGKMAKSAARLIKEWTLARRELLLENWRRAQEGEQLERIAGLDAD
jgi:DNA-binding GntR family transcriptional regulator